MAGIQLTGLASGMDWKTTVDQLMKLEQIPQDSLKAKQAANTKVQSAFDTLQTNLTALRTAAKALQTGLSGYPRSATVSGYDPNTKMAVTGASVSSGSGASLGSFEFDVKSLGKASTLSGSDGSLRASVAAAGNLKLRDYGVSAGTFTINGTNKVTLTDADLDQSVSDFFGMTASAPDLTGHSLGNLVLGNDLTATISDTTGALTLVSTASGSTTSIGSPSDTSNFLSALGLGYTSSGGGSVTFSQMIPSPVLGKVTLGNIGSVPSFSGPGNLKINGVDLGNFDSTSTLGSVISAINGSSETGVTASIDSLNGKLVLRSNSIGANPITVEAGNGLDSVLGIASSSTVAGQGITYALKHNGTPVSASDLTSNSSTLDISKYGFGATQLTVSSLGLYTVQVTGSGASYKSKINSFISAYNSLKQMLDDSTKITVGADGKVQASVFSNRSDINNLLSTIRGKIYSVVSDSSINSSYDSASKIGLGFDSSGMLSITDSTKLDTALANSPSSVDALLNLNKSASTSTPSAQLGIATRIVNLMTVMTGTSGIVSTGKNSITTQNNRLQAQIDAMTRSLAQTRSSLERGFIAMEKAQSKYQSMTQQLTAAFK